MKSLIMMFQACRGLGNHCPAQSETGMTQTATALRLMEHFYTVPTTQALLDRRLCDENQSQGKARPDLVAYHVITCNYHLLYRTACTCMYHAAGREHWPDDHGQVHALTMFRAVNL